MSTRRSSRFNDQNEYIFHDRRLSFHRIWGGFAWPGDKPGFAVIVGETLEKGPGGYGRHVLAEVESFHANELVAGAIKLKEESGANNFWGRNDEADTAYLTMYNKRSYESGLPYFDVLSANGPEDDSIVYQVNVLRDCLEPKKKSLFMFAESVLPGYLLELPQNVHQLTNVQYPAVAALGYVVSALVDSVPEDVDFREVRVK